MTYSRSRKSWTGLSGLADAPTAAIEPGLSSEARSVVGGAVDSGMSARSVAEGWERGNSLGIRQAPRFGRPAVVAVGSACGIRTRDLRLERAVSWATRRMRPMSRLVPGRWILYWLGMEDSNPHLRIQNPLSYH